MDPEKKAALDQCLLDRAAELGHAGAHASAGEVLRPLLEREPPFPGAADLMARICVRQGRLADAEKWWDQALSAQPDLISASAGLSKIRQLQRRALWLSRPSSKLGLAAGIAALLIIPWLLTGRSAGKREEQTRLKMDALHAEVAVRQQRSLDAAVTPLRAQLAELSAHADDLARIQQQNTETLNDLPKVRADLQILADDTRLRIETNALKSQQKEFIDKLASGQADMAAQANEQAGRSEKIYGAITAELQSLKQAASQAPEAAAIRVTESEARVRTALGGLQKIVQDQSAQLQAIQARLNPILPPALKFPDATVVKQGADQYVLCAVELFSQKRQITSAGKTWMKAFTKQTASLNPRPIVEVVLKTPVGSATETRNAQLAALDCANSVIKVLGYAKPSLECATILLPPSASIPADWLTAAKDKPGTVFRLRWVAPH